MKRDKKSAIRQSASKSEPNEGRIAFDTVCAANLPLLAQSVNGMDNTASTKTL